MSKLLPKLILFLLVSFFVLGFAGSGIETVQAENDNSFDPQVEIPNGSDYTLDRSTRPIAMYIKDIYTYGISIVAIAAALALMIGGVIWLTAGGSNTRVENAKKIMTGALSGLVLALGSFFLLAQINPELTKTQWFKIKGVEEDASSPDLTCTWSNEKCESKGEGWKAMNSSHCEGEHENNDFCCCRYGEEDPTDPKKSYCEWTGIGTVNSGNSNCPGTDLVSATNIYHCGGKEAVTGLKYDSDVGEYVVESGGQTNIYKCCCERDKIVK